MTAATNSPHNDNANRKTEGRTGMRAGRTVANRTTARTRKPTRAQTKAAPIHAAISTFSQKFIPKKFLTSTLIDWKSRWWDFITWRAGQSQASHDIQTVCHLRREFADLEQPFWLDV